MAILNSNAEHYAEEARILPGFGSLSLPGIKEAVTAILSTIGRVEGIFSTYTSHDISHVNAMLDMLDWLIPPTTQKEMTPVDWLLIVLAIYLHDLGMVVTSEEYLRRSENAEFQTFLLDLNNGNEGKDYMARVERTKMSQEEKDRFFYQEFIREKHAVRIREWITGRHSRSWGNTLTPLSDEVKHLLHDLPSRFRENLATVCESHHRENLDKLEYFPLCQRYTSHPKNAANVQYAAILLRSVDLIHITKDRTPSIMYKTLHLSDPKGVDEWKKQMGTFATYMKGKEFDADDLQSHVILVSADFTEERPYFALAEYIAYADKQIAQSKRWADSSQKTRDGKSYSFPWRAVKGDIRVEGREPVPMSFELDRGRLLNLLVGHTIYNDPTVAIRELLQNAIDAVRYQHHLDKVAGRQDLPMGRVRVLWDAAKREVTVEDNGVGMNLDVIKFHLMRVGSSFYDTPQFHAENADFIPISRFGIGILTCFMISDDIEMITYQQDEGHRIRMTAVDTEYLLQNIEPGNELLKGLDEYGHGTKVKLQLRDSIDLSQKSILDIVTYWVILPDCDVFYVEDDQQPQCIGFKDPEEALRSFYFNKSAEDLVQGAEIRRDSYMSPDGGKYELTFAVRKSFGGEFAFVSNRDTKAPVVCIEGIRVDDKLPGFGLPSSSSRRGICALLSVHGNKKFRTTVSRSGLEEDEEYFNVAKISLELLFKHIRNEVERISTQTGNPLSRASTAGRWLCRFLVDCIEDASLSQHLIELYEELGIIVFEKLEEKKEQVKNNRYLVSPMGLKNFDRFWTIESRLVDYLGIISRDLGRELSLNDFLSSLAPDLRSMRVNPIVSDAHMFRNEIMRSHYVSKAEFSLQDQRTSIEWQIKDKIVDFALNKDILFKIEENVLRIMVEFDVFNRYYRRGGVPNYIREIDNIVQISPIKGDLSNIHVIVSRIVIILDADSEIANIWKEMKKAANNLLNGENKDSLAAIYIAMMLLHRYIHPDSLYNYLDYPSYEDAREASAWRELNEYVNESIKKGGSGMILPRDINQVFNTKTVFDASSYWRNWDNFRVDDGF